MHDISEIFSLSQSVNEPTHKHGHLLDLVFHRHNECLLHSTCLDHGLTSDHIAVLCQLDIPKPAIQPVTTQFRSISKIDKNSFKQDLAQSITPLKTHSAQTDLWKHQKESHRLSGQCKNSFLLFQSTNKQLMQGTVPQLQCHPRQKELHTSPIFFRLTTYNKPFLNTSPTISSQYEIAFLHLIQQLPWTKPPTPGNCYRHLHQSLNNLFRKFSRTVPKSCNLDPIPTELLYENLDVLLPTITNIINISLASGFVPPDFKTAIVKPLLKKPSLDRNILKNYRPVISNLPFLSKILEKVVLHKLLAHLQENNLCNPFQSAYRTGHSTETTLLHVVNDLLNTMDEDKISVLLLLDLSAAFDTIDHQILLSRLETVFSIHSTVLQWFRSYLWTEINALLSTILLPLLLQSFLVFHRVQCWDLCCLFCTLLHFQTS